MKTLLVLACILAIIVPFQVSSSKSKSNERGPWERHHPQARPFYPPNYPYPQQNPGPYGYPTFPQPGPYGYPTFPQPGPYAYPTFPQPGPYGYPAFPQPYYVFVPLPPSNTTQ